MKRFIYIFVLSFITMSSCVPEPLLIDIDPVESRPVIWSQLLSDQVLIVYFGKSFSALEYSEEDTTDVDQELLEQLLVSSGEIILTHNGVSDTMIQIEQGVFAGFDTDFIPGDSYQLSAHSFDDNKTVYSNTEMYETVVLNDEFSYEIDSFDQSINLTINYSFTDPAGPNFYLVNFYSNFDDPLEENGENGLTSGSLAKWDIISDQDLETDLIEASYTFFDIENDTIFVSLSNISEEYYEYLEQRERGGSVFNQVFNEPINYNSNIESGFGFFNLSLPSVRTFMTEE